MLAVLPRRPRRAWLRSFGIAASLWAGVVAAAVAPLDPAWRVAAGVVVAAAAAAVASVRPRELRLAYRLWNGAARRYAAAAQTIALALAYAVVTAAGLAGSRLQLARPAPGRSLWHGRGTLPVAAYASQHRRPGRTWRGRPRTATAAWALGTGNGWALLLLPFLAFCAALDRGDERRYPTGIYTLF